MVHLFSSSELTQLCHRNIDWWQFDKLKSLLRRYVILSRGTVSRPGRGALFIYLFIYLSQSMVKGQRIISKGVINPI